MFTDHLILFILSPLLHILLVLYTKEGRKMEKNVFSSLSFYFFPPNHVTYLLFFTPPPPPPFAGSIMQNIHPCMDVKSISIAIIKSAIQAK